METTQAFEQWFMRADESLPVLTHTARCLVVGLGFVLWLAGGKLVKAACVMGGMMLGMILGGLSMAFVDSPWVAMAFMIGLGLMGALGALLAFRFWVATAAALILAIAAPAGVLIYQDVPVRELSEDAKEATEKVEQEYRLGSSRLNTDSRLQVQSLIEQGDTESIQRADQILAEQGADEVAEAKTAVFRNIEDVEAWWRDNTTNTHRTVGLAMLIGAGIGFMLGLIAPNHAAAIQSAMVGAVLIVIPGRELLASHVPDTAGLIPTTARQTLITLGLITLVGMVLQWTLYLRRDDRKT